MPEATPGESTTAGPPGTVIDLRGVVKTYDVRGEVGAELTAEIVRALGAAVADHLDAAPLIVAHDMRVSSPELAAALVEGAVRRGAHVAEAGLASTDQLYCASGLHDAAGVMVTASHNPPQDNGLKLCRAGARPISRDTGLEAIRRGAEAYLAAGTIPERAGGRATRLETLEDYAGTLRALVPLPGGRPLRVVVDAGNGMAGHTVPAVLGPIPSLTVVPLYFELDGTFPHHAANPLDLATLAELRERVVAEGADLGLAFDGDADRCVVVDETGEPVDPSALTALIATREIARARAAGEERPAVVANLVSSRHVGEAVADAGGEVVRSPVGHSLIKALMAEHDAVFGGEHSAHYYFRDFHFADSGLLAALHVIASLGESTGPLSALVAEHRPYVTSGEINSRPADAAAAVDRVRRHEGERPGTVLDELDGLTVTHWDEDAPAAERWWFSLRSSNTEPLLRLNVEAAREETLREVRDRVLAEIRREPVGAAPEPVSEPPVGPTAAGMPAWLREALRCPDCGGALEDEPAVLACTVCGRRHPVEDGIPVLIAGRQDPQGDGDD